jgi:hypothetical protein
MLQTLVDKITVNPDDVDIQLTGGLVSKIASVFIPLIKSSIIPDVLKQVQDTVSSTINDKVNPELAQKGTQLLIPYLAGVTFDFAQYNAGPQVTSDNIFEMVVNGTFFDAEKPAAAPYTPAKFPLHDASGKTGQAYLTDYSINTALMAGFETGNTLDISYLLKNYLNTSITTDMLAPVVPELLTKYGTGQPLTIAGAFVNQASKVTFSPTSDSINGFLAVTIGCAGETALKFELHDINWAGILNVAKGMLKGAISTSSMGTISNFETTLGITADYFLTTELQGFINSNIDTLNANLTAGIPIPNFMGVDASDLEIITADGYAGAGINLTPAHW